MLFYKAYSTEELTDFLFRVAIDNYRHIDYDRVVSVADWCKKMATGREQKEILVEFKVKESEAQKKQRYAIYNSRTPQVVGKVQALYNEVHRTDDIIDEIEYNTDISKATENKKKLAELLNNFDGDKDLRSWLTRKMKHYNFYDPNAWGVVEFEGSGEDRVIYPLEFSSSDVLDFSYVRNILQYITVRIPIIYHKYAGGTYIQNKYTLYAYDRNYDLIPVPEKPSELENWVEPEGYELITLTSKNRQSKQFYFKVFETLNDRCPAQRFGFMGDVETNDRTKISPIHLAEQILRRLIWRTSTHDISHALHGFYKMLMYTERCNHRETIGGHTYHCENGYVGANTCGICKGTGKRMALHDQDVIMYLLDPNSDQSPQPLSNFIHYATIDTELIKEQKVEVETAITDALSTIFNENIFDKSILANTATGIHYNWRSVNNRLMDYADHDAELYSFYVYQIAEIQNLHENLIVNYGYPSDFKLESIEELLTQRQQSISSGSPAEIIRAIDLKILSKLHRDDSQYISRFKIRDKFKPLRNKAEDERMMLIEGLPEFHSLRILNLYHEEIFDNIFIKYPNFVDIPPLRQKQVVEEEVNALIAKEQETRAALRPNFAQQEPQPQGVQQSDEIDGNNQEPQ